MLKRILMLSVGATGLIFALSACGGTDPEDTSDDPVGDADDDNGDEDDDTTDTGTAEPDSKTVQTFSYDGWFAYDEASGEIVPFLEDGNPIDSLILVMLGTSAWGGDTADTGNYCSVVHDINGATHEQWASDEGFLFGFSAPFGSITDDCLDNGFDPADSVLQGGSHQDLGSIPMQFAIGGDPSSTVEEELEAAGWTADEIEEASGGTFHNELLDSPEDSIFWMGYNVDGEFTIDYDDAIDRFSISDGAGGLTTGFYRMRQVYIWRSA